MEKRHQPRIHKRMKAEVHTSEGMTYSTAIDISKGGIFITTPDPLTEGEKVTLSIKLDDGKTVSVKGIIRWSRLDDDDNPAGMGIMFDEMSDEDNESIKKITS